VNEKQTETITQLYALTAFMFSFGVSIIQESFVNGVASFLIIASIFLFIYIIIRVFPK
jgi:hypothetical protein